ncbi:hypothetical protein BH18THE2_BH18THE2_38040 [soil metagenome]
MSPKKTETIQKLDERIEEVEAEEETTTNGIF